MKLEGFAFTEAGWVQSYGSRYVRPPIIYGDVTRTGPITVKEFKYAQSLTKKPVKGMLTGARGPSCLLPRPALSACCHCPVCRCRQHASAGCHVRALTHMRAVPLAAIRTLVSLQVSTAVCNCACAISAMGIPCRSLSYADNPSKCSVCLG